VPYGPLITTGPVVREASAGGSRRTGARAVDMEAGPLLARRGRRPAVVRAIVDTPGRPVLSVPASRAASPPAARLRRIGPALVRWSEATGPSGPSVGAPQKSRTCVHALRQAIRVAATSSASGSAGARK